MPEVLVKKRRLAAEDLPVHVLQTMSHLVPPFFLRGRPHDDQGVVLQAHIYAVNILASW